jgi:hypothetical protein
MATIRNVKKDDEIRNNLKFRVYTERDVPADASTAWFDANGIRTLKFKCKAWDAVRRMSTKITIEELVPAIATRFKLKPEQFELRFSFKAGCSCGCSPGYVGKLLNYDSEFSRSNVWVEGVQLTEANKARLDVVIAKQNANLAKEIAEHAIVVSP